MTVLMMLEKWANDLAEAGHDGDAVIVLPPRLFRDAVDEVRDLSRYAARLPPACQMTELGAPPAPAFIRFAGPTGYMTVRPEAP